MSLFRPLPALTVILTLHMAGVAAEPAAAAAPVAKTDVPAAYCRTFHLATTDSTTKEDRIFAVGKQSLTIWRPHQYVEFVGTRRTTREVIETLSYKIVSINIVREGGATGTTMTLHCRTQNNLLADLTYTVQGDTGSLSYRGPQGPTVLSGRSQSDKPKK